MIIRLLFKMDSRQERSIKKVQELYPNEDRESLMERVLYPGQRAAYNLIQSFVFLILFTAAVAFIFLLFAL